MIIDEGITQIPKKLDQWQVCQKKHQEFCGKNDKCARWIWKFCCNDWWQLCLIQRQNKVATTAGKCAKATGKNHFQTKKAVVPIQKITINCNNHRQMCLSDWAISVATTTGKCAKVIEQKHQVATIKRNRDNVPPKEDSNLLQLRCCWTFQGSNDQLQEPKDRKNFPFLLWRKTSLVNQQMCQSTNSIVKNKRYPLCPLLATINR